MPPHTDNRLVIDIGGEGRCAQAWNVNIRRTKALGPRKGEPIPRLLLARSDALPLADASVQHVIVERTPLRRATIEEIARVIVPGGEILLRHAPLPHADCHELPLAMLRGRIFRRIAMIDRQRVQETRILTLSCGCGFQPR